MLAVDIPHELWRALSFGFGMTWEVLWALILGFALSGMVQAVVSKREMRRLMPDDSPHTLAVATGLGDPVALSFDERRMSAAARWT